MLIKRKDGQVQRSSLAAALASTGAERLDRRSFLRRSGLAVGGLAAVGSIGFGSVREAQAKMPVAGKPVEMKKNMCTHCSVGCTVKAEVQEGVWVGQEPAWESPINRGTHCAKGAAVRELVKGERRIKYPMKLVNGEWQRISWDVAFDEISKKMMEIREKSGADSMWFLARRSSRTKVPICSASLRLIGARITSITRPVSATPPPLPVWRIPGVTAPRPTPTTISAMPRP